MVLLVSIQLAVFFALAATAYAAGRLLCARLPFEGGGERGAVCLAVGLAALAQGAQLLGLAGFLRPWAVLAAAAAIHLGAWRVWREPLASARGWVRGRPARRSAGVVGLAALLAAPLFAMTLYPPTDFDPGAYHLPTASAFAETGRLPFLPDLIFPIGPQLNDLLFSTVFPLSETAPHAVELLLGLSTAWLLFVWGSRAASPAAGLAAAALYLGNPLTVHLVTTAYIDAGLALFVTGALYAADRVRRSPGAGWPAVAGFLAGTAAGSKHLGLFFAVAAVLGAGLSAARGARLRSFLTAAAVGLLALAPTTLRLVAATGNPVFPFLPGLFGSSPWEPAPWLGGEPWLHRVVRVLAVPWNGLFERDLLNQQPPLSPAWLAGLPLMAWAFWKDPRARALLAFVAAWGLIFTLLPQDARYLLPVLPVAALVLTGSLWCLLSRWRPARENPRMRRALAGGLALALFLPGWAYGLFRLHRQGPIPSTAAERESYLARRLPLYPAIAHLNRAWGDRWVAFAFDAHRMVYFAKGRLLGNYAGLAPYDRYLPLLAQPEDLDRALARLGVTHLIFENGRGAQPPAGDPRFGRFFRLAFEDRRAQVYARVSPRNASPSNDILE